MDETKPFEADGRRPKTRKIGDQDPPMRSDDDVSNLSSAADQNPDLAVNLPRDLRQQTGQFLSNDTTRRNLPSINQTDSFNLFRLKTAQIAINPIDCVKSPFN